MKIPTRFTKALAISLVISIASAAPITAATFVVSNADDSGAGSLRDALTQANANGEADTIDFDPAFFATARTIVLAGELVITNDGAVYERPVTINGPGADRLTVSGNNLVRPFYAGPNAAVSMSGMTVRDGNGGGSGAVNSGGAIMCHTCALTLTNMVIRNNTVQDVGGGIRAIDPRTFLVLDSLITENTANYSGGLDEADGDVKVIRNTTISNNIAKNGTGGAHFRVGTMMMENCVITGNKAGTIVHAAGGAGQVGGLDLFQTDGTVSDTVISNNSVGFDPSGKPVTGGFHGGVSANGGPMTFRRVTVTGNRVASHNTPSVGGGHIGGMHLRAPGAPITVIDSLIAGNYGGVSGGGISTAHTGPIYVINTTIAHNGARRGGGILNHCDELTVVNSTIAGNSAAAAHPDQQSGGGGIMNLGVSARVQNSIIANNTEDDVMNGVISNGYNIVGNTMNSTGFGAPGDQLNVNPRLHPDGLGAYGGPTLTIALQANSPAINAGSNALAVDQNGAPLTSDQRGAPRVVGGTVDIGAFEVQPPDTMPGNTVTVQSPTGDATVNFSNVQQPGSTYFTPIAPESLGAAPAGYTFSNNAPAYDISTSSTYTTPVTVCFHVPNVNDPAVFARLRILHREGDRLVDRTAAPPDFATRTICARAPSLSPFVVAAADQNVPFPAPRLVSAVSRKLHAGVPFDLPLPLQGGPGIEPRSAGKNGTHQVLLTFENEVTVDSFTITSADGQATASTTAKGTVVTVDLAGVANAQTLFINLNSVSDGATTGDVFVPLAVLVGDVTADGSVNASDISAVKALAGDTANASNFRRDLNANGMINATDISIAKAFSGISLTASAPQEARSQMPQERTGQRER